MAVSPESINTVQKIQQRKSTSVGRMLRSFRVREVGHNFPEYATKLGMNPLEYSNWESGRNGVAHPEQIERWAELLNWNNAEAFNFYMAIDKKPPQSRLDEIRREWELAEYNSKFHGEIHPMVGAMNELLSYSAKQNSFMTKLHILVAVARALLRR